MSKRRSRAEKRRESLQEESFSLTQDEGVDVVVWEDEAPAPSGRQSASMLDPDSEGSNLSYSFAWKESLKRQNSDLSLPEADEEEFFTALSLPLEKEDVDSAASCAQTSNPIMVNNDQVVTEVIGSYPVSDCADRSLPQLSAHTHTIGAGGAGPADTTIHMAPTSMGHVKEDVIRINPSVDGEGRALPAFDAVEVELSEEDLLRMDEIAATQMAVIGLPATQLVTNAPVSADLDDVDLTEEDLAKLEAIERQHFQSNGSADQASPHAEASSGIFLRLQVRLVEDLFDRRRLVCQRASHPADPSNTSNPQPVAPGLACSTQDVIVELTEDWTQCEVHAGTLVHVIFLDSSFHPYRPAPVHAGFGPIYTVSNRQGLLITCPDITITPTRIAESCVCTRRAFLGDQYRGFGNLNAAAVMGNLRHTFIETLTQQILSLLSQWGIRDRQKMAPSQLMQDLQSRLHPQLAQLVQEATSKHLLELYAICVDDRLISADLLALVPWVVQWVVQLSHTTLLTLHRSQPHQRGSSPPPSDYQFLDIHSVEEAIHMPILGIKGQLDMIAHCRATSSPQHSASSSSSAPPMLVPIELKTGQWRTSTVMSHRAQVLIYMLLLHLRHHLQCRTSADSMSESMPMMIPNKIGSVGVCVYLSKSDFRMDLIWPQWDEVRHLLIARNALAWASQLRDASPLFSELSSCREDMPRILNDKFTCEGCFQAAECLLSHTAASVVAIEDGRPTTTGLTSDSEATSSISNLANLAGYILRGLRPRHIQYFKYWQQILQLESLAIAGYRDSSSKQGACQSSIYALRGAYRERVHQGRCLANCHYRSHRSIRHVRGHTLLEVILQRSAPTSAAATGNSSGNSNFESKAAVFNCPVAVGERLMLSFELESASKACLSEDVLTRILPAMATASLVSASPQGEIVLHIHQSVTNALRLFDDLVSRQQLLRKEVSIRLDREDSQVSLQTMRSALLEVMVEPFNPAAYRETSRSISRSKSEDPTVKAVKADHPAQGASEGSDGNGVSGLKASCVVGDERRRRVRELVIDLQSPLFRPHVYRPLSSSTTASSSSGQSNHAQSSSAATSSGAASTALKVLTTATDPPPSDPRMRQWLQRLANDPFSLKLLTPDALSTALMWRLLHILQFFDDQLHCIVSGAPPPQQHHHAGNPALSRPKTMPPASTQRSTSPTTLGPGRGPTPSVRAVGGTQSSTSKASAAGVVKYFQDNIAILQHDSGELAIYYTPSLQHLFAATSSSSLPATSPPAVPSSSATISATPIYTVYPGCHPLYLYGEYLQMNLQQQAAIQRIFSAQDYCLLQGYPGTGKTSLLSLLLRLLVARNHSVSFTSYTHNAIDHLLDKVQEKGFRAPFVTKLVSTDLASLSKLDASIAVEEPILSSSASSSSARPSLHLDPTQFNTLEAFEQRMQKTRLWTATVLTASRSAVFASRSRLDYCIVDEASQILEVLCLPVILRASHFVLVGDTHQLLPLVLHKSLTAPPSAPAALRHAAHPQSSLAPLYNPKQIDTTTLSLFSKLFYHHGHLAAVTLTSQYRMNAEIMSLANALIYRQEMQCGSESVASYRIRLPSIDSVVSSGRCPLPRMLQQALPTGRREDWLYAAIFPSNPVVWINTDSFYSSAAAAAAENSPWMSTSSVVNKVDAEVVRALLQALTVAGMQPGPLDGGSPQITILTPYRAQLQYLRSRMMDAVAGTSGGGGYAKWEAGTVDSFQGKDCDVIIFNTVRSPFNYPPSASVLGGAEGDGDGEDSVGMLLKDWRRLNVALTRARGKLIIVGSKLMMQQQQPSILHSLSSLLLEKEWCLDLPPAAIPPPRPL